MFDNEDDVDTPGTMVSEVGASERHFQRKARTDPEATDRWSRLRALRQRDDIEVLDLTDQEEEVYVRIRSRAFTRDHGFAAPLGAGESAVIAIADGRGCPAVIDDGPARRVLDELSPGHEVMTTREVLRVAAGGDLISSAEAQILYGDMLAEGYRGPESLW